jgi:hypothetical protein
LELPSADLPHSKLIEMFARFARLLALVSCVACTSAEESPAACAHAPLVYGDDDRYEVSGPSVDPVLHEAARAVAAVIPRSRVRTDMNGATHIDALSLGEAEQLCDGEPFAAQPSAAECTAVLIDDNLLATAGHCFTHALDCENYLFVFDYFYADGNEQLGTALTTYECRRARVRADDAYNRSPLDDYAIVELKERVVGRTPLALGAAPIAADEMLVVISSTGGVPLKVDLGARVIDPRTEHNDYFVLESDTFHGSSGAPVLDHDAALIGLFARGLLDYERDDDAGCYRIVRSPSLAASAPSTDDADAGKTGMLYEAEHASFAHAAVAALCATGYPSERLCGIAPACGDGICSPSEDEASCGSDCSDHNDPVRGVQRRPALPLDMPEARATGADMRTANGCSATRPVAGHAWTWVCATLLAMRRRRMARLRESHRTA